MLGARVVPVRGWFQAALVLVAAGELEPAAAGRILGAAGLGEKQSLDEVADLLARGHLPHDGLRRALAEVDAAWARAATEGIPGAPPYRDPALAAPIDYVALVVGGDRRRTR